MHLRRDRWWWVSALICATAVAAHGETVELLRPDALDGWAVDRGAEFPGANGALTFDDFVRMHLAYDFSGGGEYVGAYMDLNTERALDAVRIRLRKPAAARLTFRVTDRTGQTFQKPVQYHHDDWQTVLIRADGWWAHFGGIDDGVLHQPVRRIGILVESEGLDEPVGEIVIARAYAELGPPASQAPLEEGIGEVDYEVTDFRAGFTVAGPALLEDGRLDIDFRETDAVTLNQSIAMAGTPTWLTFEIEGGAPGNRVVAMLGSHYQSYTRMLGYVTGRRSVFTVPAPPQGWVAAGGAANDAVRLPLRLTQVRIERGYGPPEPTRIRAMALRCSTNIPRARAVVADTNLVAGTESDGERELTLRVRTRNLSARDLNSELHLDVTDWHERSMHSTAQKLALASGGTPAHATFSFRVPATATFVETRLTVQATRQCDVVKHNTYTQVPEVRSDTVMREESPWGMGLYLYRYPNTADGLRLMDEAASLAERAGVKWAREEFSWGAIEPRKGEYNFSFYDNVVDTAARHGIRLCGLLAYWAPWTSPYTDEGIDDFCAWARVVVDRYKDRIRHWEIYNEPNHFFWSGPKELYPVLLDRCSRAIKEVDPNAQIVGASTTGIDREFIQMCLDAEAPFDIVSVHPYRTRFSELGFIGDLERLSDQVDGRPVWITEMGWSTQEGRVTEREQAILIARTYLTAALTDACSKIAWYDFRNDGNDTSFNEYNFGVLYSDLRPKPAYRALATVCTTLQSGSPARREDFGPGVYALRMGDGIAIWAPDDREVAWRVTEGAPLVMNLMGDAINPATDNGVSRVALRGGAPVFLRGGAVEGVPLQEPSHESVLEF